MSTEATSNPVLQKRHSNPAFNAVLEDLYRVNGNLCNLPKCEDCGASLTHPNAENTLSHKPDCHCVEKCKDCGACMDYVNRGLSYHRDNCRYDPKCDGCGMPVRHSHGKESTGHHDENCYRVPKCGECGVRTDRFAHAKNCSQF